MTQAVADGLNACGMILLDHLIFGPKGNHFSLRDAGMLEVPEPATIEVQM
jgi:DNA repair protein RadC